MKKLLILLALISFGCKVKAPIDRSTNPVTVTEVKETLSFLASDEIKGRATGSEGIERSASFLEEKFKAFGLRPYFETYRDSFKVGNLDAYNVVGFLEGNDDSLKDEIIIIGAHYDHVGIQNAIDNDSIANGANDNAAGTTAVVSLARYFGEKRSNKRSLIFVLFSAEENGLIGSKHLAKRLKSKNINLYTLINFEMIGVPLIDKDYDAFISGYDLSNMAEKLNAYYGSNFIGKSEVAVKYSLFKRSDNYPFFQEFNVPCQSISSCDLSNYDYYHHVDDEIERMNFDFIATLINKLIPTIEIMSSSPTKEIKLYEK